MNIDEAIRHCEEVAAKHERQCEFGISKEGKEYNSECAADHRQLAEWLTELEQWRRVYGICPSYEMCIPECKEGYNAQITEYKRLLKAAVEDLNATVAEVYNGGLVCECCKWKSQIDGCCCPDDGGCDVAYRWRYADEVEKLLNDEK